MRMASCTGAQTRTPRSVARQHGQSLEIAQRQEAKTFELLGARARPVARKEGKVCRTASATAGDVVFQLRDQELLLRDHRLDDVAD